MNNLRNQLGVFDDGLQNMLNYMIVFITFVLPKFFFYNIRFVKRLNFTIQFILEKRQQQKSEKMSVCTYVGKKRDRGAVPTPLLCTCNILKFLYAYNEAVTRELGNGSNHQTTV